MKKDRLQILFEKYLHGSCGADEKRELVSLISRQDDPQARELLQELWESDRETLAEEKADFILDAILTPAQKVVPIRRNYVWAKAAAVTALLLLAGVAFFKVSDSVNTKTAAVQNEIPAQPQFLLLPDGSKVILNNSSTLKYADSFEGKSAREVYLTGEAFFDIAHDQSKPFIVHTEKISTTVMGTAFNIRAYPDQHDITITVTRGKVKVSNDARVLGILTHDEQITFRKGSEDVEMQNVKGKEAVVWMEKDIFFDNVTMLDALQELKQRFDVNIALENPNLNDCRFTATFIKGEDLLQILDVICEFNQAKYTLDDAGNIVISGEGC